MTQEQETSDRYTQGQEIDRALETNRAYLNWLENVLPLIPRDKGIMTYVNPMAGRLFVAVYDDRPGLREHFERHIAHLTLEDNRLLQRRR